MEYTDLLNSHLKYGSTKEDIIKRLGHEKIQENVIIAPWWDHTIFDNYGFEIEQIGDKIYNFYKDDISFSYIELKMVGAPALMELLLPLGVTNCKNIIFLGSAGSLDENIKIGDIVIPEYSICGDGASRYLNSNLEDEFMKKEYPSKDITNELLEILKEEDLIYHNVPNFSIDTIFAQFYHLDKIIESGAKTIEMETALLFKCNELLKLNTTAIFCISDNTTVNKSLYSGRTEEEKIKRHNTRDEVIPKIVVELLQRIHTKNNMR